MVEWIADIASGRAVSAAHAPAVRHHNWPGIRLLPIRDLLAVDWALVWNPANETAAQRALLDIARAEQGEM